MNYRIAVDSSCNLFSFPGVDFASVPLKIVTDKKEYVDDEKLDCALMLEELAAYKGRSGTACPNVGEWLEAFGQGERIFALAITSSLSAATMPACRPRKSMSRLTPADESAVLTASRQARSWCSLWRSSVSLSAWA